MGEADLSVIGFARFSVNPRNILDAGARPDDLDTLEAAVYDDGRLRHRFDLFVNFTLPSMDAAAGRYPGFHFVVLISPELPEAWKVRLAQLSDERRWLRIETVLAGQSISNVTEQVVHALAGGRRSFNFRIDDDDALSPRFIAAVLDAAERVGDSTVLSFDKGFYLQRIAEAEFYLHPFKYPKIAIGLGVFSGAGAPESVFSVGVHTKIDPVRVVNIDDRHYWIRTLHSHNDSGMRAKEENRVTLEEAAAVLGREFGFLPLRRALRALPQSTVLGKDETALRALFHIQ